MVQVTPVEGALHVVGVTLAGNGRAQCHGGVGQILGIDNRSIGRVPIGLEQDIIDALDGGRGNEVGSHIIDADDVGVFQVPQRPLGIALPGCESGWVFLRVGNISVGIEVPRGMGMLHEELGVMLTLGLHGEVLAGIATIDLPVGNTCVFRPLGEGLHLCEGNLAAHPDAEPTPAEGLQFLVEALHLLLGLHARVGGEVLGVSPEVKIRSTGQLVPVTLDRLPAVIDEEGEVLAPPLHVMGPAVFLVEDIVVTHFLLSSEVGEFSKVGNFSTALLPVVLHIPGAPVVGRILGGFIRNEIG